MVIVDQLRKWEKATHNHILKLREKTKTYILLNYCLAVLQFKSGCESLPLDTRQVQDPFQDWVK